ncbi:MAG TPA: hypothetical protein VF801_13775 [Rhodocyclaceae bacterium]
MKTTMRGIAVLLLLAGCATSYEWQKPGTGAAARDADLMACGTRNAHLDKDDPAAVSVIDGCMKERGYRKVAR